MSFHVDCQAKEMRRISLPLSLALSEVYGTISEVKTLPEPEKLSKSSAESFALLWARSKKSISIEIRCFGRGLHRGYNGGRRGAARGEGNGTGEAGNGEMPLKDKSTLIEKRCPISIWASARRIWA